MKKLIIILFLFISVVAYSTTYYVSTTGSDINPGTLAEPFASFQKGINTAIAGDTVYLRGGIYYMTTSITINPSTSKGVTGTLANPIVYINYPGEIPIFDFSNIVLSGPSTFYNTGLTINSVQYCEFNGFTVRNIWQGEYDGYYVSCQGIATSYTANLTFKNLTIHNISGRAFGYSTGAWNVWDGAGAVWASDSTSWVNCDVYDLCDTINYYVYTTPGYPDWAVGDTAWRPGNSADGWKTHGYQNNIYYWEGCRAWNYSDDGFDPSGECYKYFKNCWFMSSAKYEAICHYEQAGHEDIHDMEGNGIKMTAPYSSYYFPDLLADTILVKVRGCVGMYCLGDGVFNNLYLSGTTYLDNNALIYNNTLYKNNIGFFENSTTLDRGVTYKNNIAYNPGTTYEAGLYSPSIYNESHNTWDANMTSTGWPGWEYTDTVTISDADFITSDSVTLVSLFTASRQADGSLPINKPLQLIAGSDMIDAGVADATYTALGLTYEDTAPDIGYVEYSDAVQTGTDITSFTFPDIVGVAVINATTHTITGVLKAGEDITEITPTFTLSSGATSDPASGVEDDYTNPVVITVTAEDAVTEQEWTVTITEDDDPIPTVATVGTTSADYTAITANVSGRIYSANGGTLTARGVCWSTTNTSPTTSDKHTTYTPYVGSFTDIIRGLNGNTTYYFRAYATTSEGGTSYGDAITVTTLERSVPLSGGSVLMNGSNVVIIN